MAQHSLNDLPQRDRNERAHALFQGAAGKKKVADRGRDPSVKVRSVMLAEQFTDTNKQAEQELNPGSSAATGARNWRASLTLNLTKESSRTILKQAAHQGPLRVQRPFYPEGAQRPHIYILHPPGGLVCGDEIEIDARVEQGAGALFTTPSAGKIYRTDAAGHRQCQTVRLHCAAADSLEWLPQENIIYDGADGAQTLQLHTSAASRFIVWEITALGRPAADAPFAHGAFTQTTQILRDGAPCFFERVALRGEGPGFQEPWGLQGQQVYGSLLAGYEKESPQKLLQQCREALQANTVITALEVDKGLRWTLTRKDDLIILRALCQQSEPIKHLFMAAWSLLRPALIGVESHPPRIWAT
ncbi:urease accessory protein UreD [Hahella aquimaris]|uniref:urease accessory protein UreD n=1 Tax=Hahella sp. HNIBRBA332 TaxID=3015983 RepID=UPI00273C350C|nr:urease accessory protein UreD [Hahella sp. HNIBRBA332]WLQ17341.1 urease accessory protein UreD [Hahella sp. HNIBRBA332]